MRFVKHIFSLIIPFVLLLFLAGQLFWWRNMLIGAILFILFLCVLGSWWQELYRRVFAMRHHEFITRILSYATVIILLSFIAAIFVAWYRITSSVIMWIFIITMALSYLLRWYARSHTQWQSKKMPIGKGSSLIIFPRHAGLLAAYGVLWFAGLYFLLMYQSTEALQSPWQSVNPYYLPIFFLLSSVLGFLLFSKYSIRLLLVLVIAHGFLLHLYLPLSHTLPWGGDVWRHIGIEAHLAEEKPVLPILFGPHMQSREFGPLVVPAVLLTPEKYTYTQLWGLTVVLHRVLDVSLVNANIWLMPVLWSLVVPLLLFRIGATMLGSWRAGLLFSTLTFIAFPFQALGSLTLPVSLGFVTFFLALALWLHAQRTHNGVQRMFALCLGFFMIFGYPLHFILFWLIVGVSVTMPMLMKISNARIRFTGFAILLIVSSVILPSIEIIAGISYLPDRLPSFDTFKQLVGQFSGWYIATGIRPHDIVSGNIFFNHVPAASFVDSVFLRWRWFFIPVMLGLYGLCAYGMWQVYTRKQRIWIVWTCIFIGSFIGYAISWFVLDGERLFARRLDLFLSFLLLLFAGYGVAALLNRDMTLWIRRSIVVIGIIIVSWIGTATYATGPDLRVVSSAEFDAVSYVLQEEGDDTTSRCIIADTWTLLALEGLSARTIVGGGFPIDRQFGQPDRVRIFNTMVVSPSQEILQEAHMLTGAGRCWMILPKSHVGQDVIQEINQLMNGDVQEVESLYLWHEQRTSTLESQTNIK